MLFKPDPRDCALYNLYQALQFILDLVNVACLQGHWKFEYNNKMYACFECKLSEKLPLFFFSFLPALKVMGDCSGVQSATSLPGPFYGGPPDIPFSALQPHLMSLLSAYRKPWVSHQACSVVSSFCFCCFLFCFPSTSLWGMYSMHPL